MALTTGMALLAGGILGGAAAAAGSRSPSTPDYGALAQQQGAANLDAARTTTRLSNPNIYGPLGSQTVSYQPVFNEQAYNRAMEDYKKNLDAYNAGTSKDMPYVPERSQFMSEADVPTIFQTLSPEAQKTLEAQQRMQLALGQLGETGIAEAQKVLKDPFKYQGPGIQTSLGGGVKDVEQNIDLERYGLAGANVNAQPIDYGPRMGQYGLAQAGPSAGQFGMQEGGVQGPQLQTSLDTGGQIERGPQMGQYGYAQGGPGGPQLQGRLDTSQLAAMPINAGMTAQNAIMSRLQPQLQAQRAQLETQLANQGLVRGGEAYNAAMAEQGQKENDLLTQAALQGLNLDMAARQQGLGEQQALGGFANQAALSQFGAGQQAAQAQNAAMQQNYAQALATAQQGNAAQQQAFQQRVQAGEFGNQAQLASFNANLQNQQARNQAAAQNFAQSQAANQAYNQAVQQNMAMGMGVAQAQNAASQQLFNQNMDIQGLYNAALAQNQQTALAQQSARNAAQNQAFNQALQQAQFGNQAAQQSLAQQLALRSQPLNEISALMSGSQIQMPQFQGYQGANVAASPVFAAGQAQAQDAMARYNAQQASNNALMSGLFGLGSSYLTRTSDRRLKSNIVKVGDDPRGFGIYEYDIFGRRERGVMAQEVEKIIPDAVIEGPDGYKMVNYGAL